MVTEWQNHRQDLSIDDGERGEVNSDTALRRLLRDHRAASARFPVDVQDVEEIEQAVKQLGDVLSSEMIDPDDPRATGTVR